MSNKYELKRDGELVGTYTSSELRKMVASGELKRDDHIRQLSSDKLKKSQWTKAGRVKSLEFQDVEIESQSNTISDDFIVEPETIPSKQDGPGDETMPRAPQSVQDSTNPFNSFKQPSSHESEFDSSSFNSFAIFAVILDKFVDWLSNLLGNGKLIKNKASITALANLGLICALVLILIGDLWIAIKIDSMAILIDALLTACIIAIGQFLAVKFIQSGSQLLDSSPTKINNMEVIRLLGFLIIAITVGICIVGIYYSIKLSQLEPAAAGVVTLLIGIIGASLVFSPQHLNITRSDETSAGMELLGLVSFYVKMNLVLAPYVYLLGTVASIVFGLRCLYFMSQNELGLGLSMSYSAAGFVVIGSIFPFLMYLFFLFYYLLIDVIRAILDIDINVRKIKKDKD